MRKEEPERARAGGLGGLSSHPQREQQKEVGGRGEWKKEPKQRMRPAQQNAFCGVLIKPGGPIVPFMVKHMFRAWLRFGNEISMVLGLWLVGEGG